MNHQAGPLAAHRWDAAPDRVALILPGSGYTPARPLLHFARLVLFRHGWTVQELWWRPPAWHDARDQAAWVSEQADAAIDAESASTVLLVGKSLGSLATPVAAKRGLPAIWLTPLLTNPDVVAALAAAGRPTLLIGGVEDPMWDSIEARRLGLPFLELAEADHALEIAGDPVGSAHVLMQVAAQIDSFLTGLSGGDTTGAATPTG